MNILKDNQIIIRDDDGKETIMNVLFTYENEQRNKNYVFFYDPSDEENIMVMSYDESTGELFEISDEEFDEAEEVLDAYQEDPKIQEIK